MTARIVRPSAKAMLRYTPLLPAVFIFAGGQLYLARLTPSGAIGFAAIVLLAALAFTLGWLAFLRNARVCVESDDVTVFDWLGRVAFKVPRTDVRLESFAIRYWGIYRDVVILARADGSAGVPLWRDTWGKNTSRKLSSLLRDVPHSSQRLVSARKFETSTRTFA